MVNVCQYNHERKLYADKLNFNMQPPEQKIKFFLGIYNRHNIVEESKRIVLLNVAINENEMEYHSPKYTI